MSTRRIGAACETAHRAGPGTMKFSADRQKFWVALPPNQPASTVRPPMLTSSGFRPRPITEVLKPTLTLTAYWPGLNSSASRRVPNWLLSCAANTASTADWTLAVDIDGSNTRTFGPRSPPPGRGEPPPVLRTWNPQRGAVAGGPLGAVHPDVPAGAGGRERLGAAGPGGGGVERGP